jgi:hypothetical protein
MAATIEIIKRKIELLGKSNKFTKAARTYYGYNFYNCEPFSIRKTSNSLEQIFDKLLSTLKSIHNRKYLQSFFPYYVFYDNILDLEGNIVLLIRRETVNVYASKFVFHVTKDFYSKYKDQVDYVHTRYGGDHSNPDYRVRLEVEDVEDIYYIFHKQYTFSNFIEKKSFKEELINKISINLLQKQKEYLGPAVEFPF